MFPLYLPLLAQNRGWLKVLKPFLLYHKGLVLNEEFSWPLRAWIGQQVWWGRDVFAWLQGLETQ